MPEIAFSANADAAPAVTPQPTLQAYAIVTTTLLTFGIALKTVVRFYAQEQARTELLLGPVFLLVLLVAAIWLLMVGLRNYAVLRGIADANYYAAYRDRPPPDWIERPARAFNNLMQAPTLFYVVCALMMITAKLDAAQLWLAWIFVATRVLHAVVYIVWNHIPTRFCCWNMAMITLVVLWTRFAIQAWPSLG